jgi:hypothetical protein
MKMVYVFSASHSRIPCLWLGTEAPGLHRATILKPTTSLGTAVSRNGTEPDLHSTNRRQGQSTPDARSSVDLFYSLGRYIDKLWGVDITFLADGAIACDGAGGIV